MTQIKIFSCCRITPWLLPGVPLCPGEKWHHLCGCQGGHRPVLRPDILLPPGEARLPDLSQHRGLPPRYVPGPPPLLCHPRPGRWAGLYKQSNNHKFRKIPRLVMTAYLYIVQLIVFTFPLVIRKIIGLEVRSKSHMFFGRLFTRVWLHGSPILVFNNSNPRWSYHWSGSGWSRPAAMRPVTTSSHWLTSSSSSSSSVPSLSSINISRITTRRPTPSSSWWSSLSPPG